MGRLVIDSGKCIGCGLCSTVCAWDRIAMVDLKATERADAAECTACGLCMSVCPKAAVEVASLSPIKGEFKPCGMRPPITYKEYMRLLSEHRSTRWFTDQPVSDSDFRKIFDAAGHTLDADDTVDVRFVVIRKEIRRFAELIARILKPLAEDNRIIAEFEEYVKNPSNLYKDASLWTGGNVVLAFSSDATDARMAMSRIEFASDTLGLGGCYCKWIPVAYELDRESFMGFFPEIPEGMGLGSSTIIGHPQFKFARTTPPPMRMRASSDYVRMRRSHDRIGSVFQKHRGTG